MLSALKVIKGVMKLLSDIEIHSYIHILSLYIQYALMIMLEFLDILYCHL